MWSGTVILNGRNVVSSRELNHRDPDGDVLHVIAFTQGSHGTLSDAGKDSLLHTPEAGFTEQDRFTYTVSDGKGGTASGTVIVQVTSISSIG